VDTSHYHPDNELGKFHIKWAGTHGGDSYWLSLWPVQPSILLVLEDGCEGRHWR